MTNWGFTCHPSPTVPLPKHARSRRTRAGEFPLPLQGHGESALSRSSGIHFARKRAPSRTYRNSHSRRGQALLMNPGASNAGQIAEREAPLTWREFPRPLGRSPFIRTPWRMGPPLTEKKSARKSGQARRRSQRSADGISTTACDCRPARQHPRFRALSYELAPICMPIDCPSENELAPRTYESPSD